ncbi:hypothetical protein C0995_011801 [Termitomyces sp. Mi166|nr:hypothetical protein C0995_011801 [Termitomyces sp. Mi166\
MSLSPAASTEVSLATPQGFCALSYAPLDVNSIVKFVQDDGAGAVALFIGTTRNSFKGKAVTRLEYQAYSKLAIKTMANIMREAASAIERSEHQTSTQGIPSLIRCAIHHRLGSVSVGEPSIGIRLPSSPISSPHRREAFVACESILENVKRRAQIWKREYYEGKPDREAEWKGNQ